MIPYSRIKIGDVFSDPYGYGRVDYHVIDKDDKEKLIEKQGYGGTTRMIIGHPFWKRNTNSTFKESWRVLDISRYKVGKVLNKKIRK